MDFALYQTFLEHLCSKQGNMLLLIHIILNVVLHNSIFLI